MIQGAIKCLFDPSINTIFMYLGNIVNTSFLFINRLRLLKTDYGQR